MRSVGLKRDDLSSSTYLISLTMTTDTALQPTSPAEVSGALPAAPRQPRRWLRHLVSAILFCSLPFILLFFYSLLGRFFFVAELAGNFRLQILWLLLPFFALAVLCRRWRWTALLGLATLWASLGTVSAWLPTWQPPPGPAAVRVLSFNLLGSNLNTSIVQSRLDELDADVMVFLEYANHWEEALSVLNKKYPYQIKQPRWHGFGIAMFSKTPLSHKLIKQITREKTDNPVIAAEFKIGAQQVRLIGIHAVSPTNPFRLDLRNQQLLELQQLVNQKEVPTIVVGDFNCAPWSPFLSSFLRNSGLRDSRQGFGNQPSWHAELWPLSIPIDHAFVSPTVHVHDRFLAEPAGSDHLPLVIDISTSPQ